MMPGSNMMRRSLVLMRLMLAVMALVSQLTLGALALPDGRDDDLLAQLHAVRLLCTGSIASHGTLPQRHHHPDHATLPLSLALALPAVILTAIVILPRRLGLHVTDPVLLPPARGPPSLPAWALFARGPPILS